MNNFRNTIPAVLQMGTPKRWIWWRTEKRQGLEEFFWVQSVDPKRAPSEGLKVLTEFLHRTCSKRIQCSFHVPFLFFLIFLILLHVLTDFTSSNGRKEHETSCQDHSPGLLPFPSRMCHSQYLHCEFTSLVLFNLVQIPSFSSLTWMTYLGLLIVSPSLFITPAAFAAGSKQHNQLLHDVLLHFPKSCWCFSSRYVYNRLNIYSLK